MFQYSSSSAKGENWKGSVKEGSLLWSRRSGLSFGRRQQVAHVDELQRAGEDVYAQQQLLQRPAEAIQQQQQRWTFQAFISRRLEAKIILFWRNSWFRRVVVWSRSDQAEDDSLRSRNKSLCRCWITGRTNPQNYGSSCLAGVIWRVLPESPIGATVRQGGPVPAAFTAAADPRGDLPRDGQSSSCSSNSGEEKFSANATCLQIGVKERTKKVMFIDSYDFNLVSRDHRYLILMQMCFPFLCIFQRDSSKNKQF